MARLPEHLRLPFAQTVRRRWDFGLGRRQLSGAGMTLSRMDWAGGFSFIFFSSLVKQLWPACHQRAISAMTRVSVNSGKYRRSDSNTLTRIVCRRAPTNVLLVRPAARAPAGFRSVRSDSLFVPATG